MFGLQSIGGSPIVASRFATFRHMFLRHASAVSTAIAKNVSMEVVQPSQLVHPSDHFEDTHRHYSFMAVLAMMSLFLLITVSMTGLLLGFCRKKSSSSSNYSRSEDKMDPNSQFELNDIDLEVETKMCKGDPHDVCYYHLSDDDGEDDDDDDDDYGGGDDDRADARSKRSRKERRRERKWKKLRNKGFYFHLYSNDDEDSCDEKDHAGCSHGHKSCSTAPDSGSTKRLLPKRSTTFPQLHNVLTSCIRGRNPNPDNVQYQKLEPSPAAGANAYTFNDSIIDIPSASSHRSTHTCSSPSSSSSKSSDTHRHQHVHASVQIKNSNSGAHAVGHYPEGKSARARHAHHRNRQARNQRQHLHQHHPLHQYNKLRPRHTQHYSSLSHHRHTRLHHAIKHNVIPRHKRVPVVWPEGGGGFLYKSHSIHAIPCSEPSSGHRSAGTLEGSQCPVQIKVERVHYNDDDEEEEEVTTDLLLAHERV